MKRLIVKVCLLVVSTTMLLSTSAVAQGLSADGKAGLSIFSGGGSSTGLLFGGGIDFPITKSLYARPELNITTHAGTPIEIAGELKYYIPSSMKPSLYVDGGLGIWFRSGGSSLGLDFGGGAIFPIEGAKFSIPAEIRLGPVFESGSTAFQIGLTTGIRFGIN